MNSFFKFKKTIHKIQSCKQVLLTHYADHYIDTQL